MEQNQTSWENFFRNDSSNMLEDALPYLPPNLKKVAAIYIKLTELSKSLLNLTTNRLFLPVVLIKILPLWNYY